MFELPLTTNELSLLGLILLTFTCLLITTIFLCITRVRLEKMIDERSPFGFQYDILQNQLLQLHKRVTQLTLIVRPDMVDMTQFGTQVAEQVPEPDPASLTNIGELNVSGQSDTGRN